MIYLFVGVCILLSLTANNTEKNLFNPVTIFSGLWGIIIFLSSLHLFGLDNGSSNIYIMFFCGIIAFSCGYYITKNLIKNRRFVINHNSFGKGSFDLNYRLIYLFALICIPFYLKDLISVVSMIGSGRSLGAIQNLLQSGTYENTRSSIENAIRLLIVTPFTCWMCGPILCTEFWFGKRDKKLILLLFFLAMLRVFSTGGRATIIQLAFCFVCTFTFFNSNNKANSIELKRYIKNNKKLFIRASMLILLLVAWMTYSRSGLNALKTIYYDFAMQPLMYEKWVSEVDSANLIGYGTASLNGFLFPVDYILRNTLHINLGMLYKKVYTMIALTDSKWQYISPTIRANAYVSAFWFFYLDARNFGVLIFSFIYGCYCRMSFKNAVFNSNLRSIAVYSLVAVGVFYTFGRFQLSQHTYVLALLYLKYFMFKRSSIRNEIE